MAVQRRPNAREAKPMSSAEFNRILTRLGQTPDEAADLLGRAPRQFYNYKNGSRKIPYLVAYAMRQLNA